MDQNCKFSNLHVYLKK